MENEMNPGNQQLSITVYHSGQHGNAQNCTYPYTGTGSTPEELKKLFRYDHTFIRFRNNYRSKGNFLEVVVATLDNDNDHSDDPDAWIPIDAIPKLFPGVPCVISTSRNHMKQKGNRSPRPRYHVAFQMDTINTPAEYTAFLPECSHTSLSSMETHWMPVGSSLAIRTRRFIPFPDTDH